MNCTQSRIRLKTLTGTRSNFENFVFSRSLSVSAFGRRAVELEAVAALSVCHGNIVLTQRRTGN